MTNVEIAVVALFAVSIGVIIFLILKSRDYRQKFNVMKIAAKKHEDDIFKLEQQTIQNLNKTIPDGEILLFQEIRKLLGYEVYKAFTFYNQLTCCDMDKNCKKIDYFLVSPYGLWVIESKEWNGVTYLFHKNDHLLTDTQFNTFGKGSSNLKISVFNVKRGFKDNELIISDYDDPVAQARKYSKIMSNILNPEPVKNVIVFNADRNAEGEQREIMFDNAKLTIAQPDYLTTVMTDSHFVGYFAKEIRNERRYSDGKLEDIHSTINKYCTYRFKVDAYNIEQAPFPMIKLMTAKK